jgi:hypothetical protein
MATISKSLDDLLTLASSLIGNSFDDLLELPELKESHLMALLDVLFSMAGPMYMHDANRFLYIMSLCAQYSLTHGISPHTSVAYAWTGITSYVTCIDFPRCNFHDHRTSR